MTGTTRTLFSAGAVLAAVLCGLVSAVARAEQPPLTCTHIATRCQKACEKQAGQEFCADYCARARNECLRSGHWDTMGYAFAKVIRR